MEMISLNNGSFQGQSEDVPSPIHRRTPSDSFTPAGFDPVDRTRVDYVPLPRSHFDTPSIEVSPRTYMSPMSTSMRSPSVLLKANTFNLGNVSTASVESLSSTVLTQIMQQRKRSLQPALSPQPSTYYQDLAAPIYERTQRWRHNSTSRLQSIKAQNYAMEAAECSFTPSLAPKTDSLCQPSESVSERTYKWQAEVEKRHKEAKVRVEEEVSAECPFKPTLVGGDSGGVPSFNGKQFYAKNLAWQKEVKAKTTSPKVSIQPVKRPFKPSIIQVKVVKRPELDSELAEFKQHAASLSKLLSPGSISSKESIGSRAAVTVPSVKLKTKETRKTDIRQELLKAKIAFLESQVEGVLGHK